MITRREALAGAAGLAAACLPMPALARHHAFKLGDFEVTVVSDGALSLPISFVLPSTPPAEIDALFAANGLDANKLQSQVNVIVVKTPSDLILIDAGAGTDFMTGLGKFPDALKAAGIEADKVTKVVFTHLHADHFWGAIDEFETARYVNAEYIVSAAELDFWRSPDSTSKVPETFLAMAAGTQRRLKLIDAHLKTAAPGNKIAPGVALLDTSGHTPGHVAVLLESKGQTLLIGGDVANQSLVSFARPEWRWGADMDPAKASVIRRRMLDILSTDPMPFIGTHLPWPGMGWVERKDGAFRFVQG
jgi:glyoxylase-like metal-dependent hydrolase (beta-lactamase superfamily II)